MEVSTPAAEGNTQSTHLSLSMAQQNAPSPRQPSTRAHTVSTDSPEVMGRKALGPKLRLCFLIFWLSTCHHHRRTSSAFWIQPTVLTLSFLLVFSFPEGFSPRKSVCSGTYVTHRRATGCRSIFTTMAHFEDNSFFPYRNTIFYWKPLALGFVITSPLFACSTRGNTITEISPSCRNTMLCCC